MKNADLIHKMALMYDSYFAKSRPSVARFLKRVAKDIKKEKLPSEAAYINRLEVANAIADLREREKYQVKTVDVLAEVTDTVLDEEEVYKKVINCWDGKYQVKLWTRPKTDPSALPKAGYEKKFPPTEVHTEENSGHVTMFIPDVQIGFAVNKVTNKYIPFHDRQALELAVTIAEATQPDRLIILGDFIDLPAMSRFRKDPSLKYTSKASMDEAWYWLVRFREACPNAEMDFIEGNHEKRYRDRLIDNADEFVGMTQGGKEDLINSIEHILRMDEMHINYVGDYPNGSVSLYGQVKVMHGFFSGRTGGVTAAKYLNEFSCSTVYGHTHKLEIGYSVDKGVDRKDVFAMCPGTLCKIGGSPGHGAPRHTQGVGFIAELPSGHLVPTLIPFHKQDDSTSALVHDVLVRISDALDKNGPLCWASEEK